MIDFEYFRPQTIGEAVRLYNKYGEKAKLLAGGTELMNEFRLGKSKPEQVIDIKHIKELDFIELTADGLRIGALYRLWDVECSEILRNSPFNVLSYVAGTMASPQVRNKATIVGNVCRSSPSADMLPPLIALGAKAKIIGKEAERIVPVEDISIGPGKTILKPGEILTEIQIPNLAEYSGCTYYKVSPRKSMDLAVVGVAVMLRTDPDMTACIDARIVLGAVGPTAIRARKAESMLIGKKLNVSAIEDAGKTAVGECNPIDDVRSTAWYRKQMIAVGVKRTIGFSMKEINKRKK
ncbi:MAG: xanthine dehydrogenase family protein subunit M [Spirochaetota bacterium]